MRFADLMWSSGARPVLFASSAVICCQSKFPPAGGSRLAVLCLVNLPEGLAPTYSPQDAVKRRNCRVMQEVGS